MIFTNLIVYVYRVFAYFKPTKQSIWKHYGAKIGKRVYISRRADTDHMFAGFLEIEDDVVISDNCLIILHDGSMANILKMPCKVDKVILRRNCYLGAGVIIMPGVEIGENCLIGAGSLVTKSCEKNSVYYGRPAAKVRSLDEQEKRSRETMKQQPDKYWNLWKSKGWFKKYRIVASLKTYLRSINSAKTTHDVK